MKSSLIDRALFTYRKGQRYIGKPFSMKPLFFLHLPKCGGNSVNEELQKKYIRAGYHLTHLNPYASKWAAEIAGENLRDFRSRLLLYEMAQKNSQYISGHFSYSEQAWKAFSHKWHFMTMLREPVARWYSFYFFNRYKAEDHFRIDEPLDVFIESKRASDYGQDYIEKLTDIDQETELEYASKQAIANLQRFSLVGILEESDIFIRDCEQFLGVPIKIKHLNKNPRTIQQQKNEISAEIAERVNKLCEPNRHIYETIKAKILKQGSWLKA